MVIAEADGSAAEAARLQRRARRGRSARMRSRCARAPERRGEVAALWRWRDGVSIAVEARRGGKVSEDIVVPLDRLAEAIEETVAIGARHGLEACSWGHAGDGNLHSTFLVDPATPPSSGARRRAAGSCSRSPCSSAARSPASTASAG